MSNKVFDLSKRSAIKTYLKNSRPRKPRKPRLKDEPYEYDDVYTPINMDPRNVCDLIEGKDKLKFSEKFFICTLHYDFCHSRNWSGGLDNDQWFFVNDSSVDGTTLADVAVMLEENGIGLDQVYIGCDEDRIALFYKVKRKNPEYRAEKAEYDKWYAKNHEKVEKYKKSINKYEKELKDWETKEVRVKVGDNVISVTHVELKGLIKG